MTGSLQQREYLAARADGATMMTACVRSGIAVEEARLIENAVMRGEIITTPAAGPAETIGEAIMAKRAKPGDSENRGVTNLSETKEVIREAVSKILKLKGERKEINAAIGEQRARVKNYGVPPAALDLALRMKEADPQDRQLHDEGYAIARDALGLGLQRSLFEMIEEPTGGEATGNGALAAAKLSTTDPTEMATA